MTNGAAKEQTPMARHGETSRWCVPARTDPASRHWGNEYVVHHALSNDTHRLAELGGRILSTLKQAGPLDPASLAGACGVSVEEVAATLDALAQVDLVARC